MASFPSTLPRIRARILKGRIEITSTVTHTYRDHFPAADWPATAFEQHEYLMRLLQADMGDDPAYAARIADAWQRAINAALTKEEG